ncbi:MAG: ABC transporter permease, partial [Lachnospiraceae bacterium]|nr:ABC transporter permease [Lachnospiraceae bacterium]
DRIEESVFTSLQIEGIAKERSNFFALYGGLFFLGILLGIVFVFAAVLIMYYKQVSEGYEDQSRFEIMQKVGMTKEEIKKSVNSQVITVFFLPLLAAGLHLAFAFPMINKCLVMFGLMNGELLAVVTLICFGVFALLYVAVYRITSHSYYAIVSGMGRDVH